MAKATRRATASTARRMGAVSTTTWLVALTCALCAIGVVMVGSASSVISMSYYGSPWSIFIKEVMWVALGLIVFVVVARTDYHAWRRFAPLLMVATLALLVIVLVPGFGVASGGSSRWIGYGQFRLQPSELMKLALALFGADLIARRQEKGASFRQFMGPLCIVAALAAALVVKQPDLGTAMVLLVITLALLFAGGVPLRTVAQGILVIVVLVAFAAVAMPYRRERLLSFINPGAKASGSGYQVVQSLIGLGSGHLFGLGLGNSREKWGFLPNAHTDFIFSIIGEELGLVGAVAVIVLIALFALKGLKAAEEARDPFGSLLGVSLVAWIAAEAVINIGAVIDVLPVTGIPLPFISFGGSSMVITMVAAGMLVNISRQAAQSATITSLDQRRTPARPRSSSAPRRASSPSGTPAKTKSTTSTTQRRPSGSGPKTRPSVQARGRPRGAPPRRTSVSSPPR